MIRDGDYAAEWAVLLAWSEGFRDRDGKFCHEFQVSFDLSIGVAPPRIYERTGLKYRLRHSLLPDHLRLKGSGLASPPKSLYIFLGPLSSKVWKFWHIKVASTELPSCR